MKGKVLGFDPASGTGAINGDDGKRYKFTAADNKSPQPLKPNDSVDFEADGDSAKDIYAVKTGFSLPTGGGAPAAGGAPVAGGDIVQQILAKPNVIWAAVVILGSLIGGYLAAIGNIGGGPGGAYGFAGFVSSLLFAIPVLAGVLVFFELTNHKLTPTFRLVTGAVAIGGPILLPLLTSMFMPQGFGFAMEFASAFGMGGAVGGGIFSFAITPGLLITVAGGVLILLTHFGIIKKLG